MYSYTIEKAIQAACVLHAPQSRKGPAPIPYVSHLFSVFTILHDYTADETTLVASLLHDTLEDTDYTKEALIEDFGDEVAAVVVALSENKSINDWVERKNDYLNRLSTGGRSALLIAAADKIHNIRSMIEQYHDDVQSFMGDFAQYHDKGLVFFDQLAELLNTSLENDIVVEFNHVLAEFKQFNRYVETYQKNHA